MERPRPAELLISAQCSANLGTVFSVEPDGSSYSDRWAFDATTGGGLTTESLMLAGDGNLYGTGGGGTNGCGIVYRFAPPSTLKPLHDFSCGDFPENVPFEAKDKNLYGVSAGGVYRLTLKGAFTALPNSSAGGNTFAPLMQASDGNLYGTTIDGGTCGTIFRLATAGGSKTVYTFTGGTDQYSPYSPLLEGADGNLYGTALGAGLCGYNSSQVGIVFQFIPGKSPKFTTMHSFSGPDGEYPYAGLVPGPGGSLIGVTSFGGSNGDGTVFEIGTSSPFTLKTVADFASVNSSSQTTLFLNTNGSYYGLANAGGAYGTGYLYKLEPSGPKNVLVEGPVWVKPEDKVTILGDNLGEAI
jgi:uncharacterized repeat protein (TIGR03803 family)